MRSRSLLRKQDVAGLSAVRVRLTGEGGKRITLRIDLAREDKAVTEIEVDGEPIPIAGRLFWWTGTPVEEWPLPGGTIEAEVRGAVEREYEGNFDLVSWDWGSHQRLDSVELIAKSDT